MMTPQEQVKEICRQYLEGEISMAAYFQRLMNIMYVAEDPSLIRWMCEQLLIARD